MEDSVEKHEVVPGTPKKSRSLDIHQLYEEKGVAVSSGRSRSESGDVLKRKRRRTGGDNDDSNNNKKIVVGLSRRKSKSQKDILLRSLKASVKKSKNDTNGSSSKPNMLVSDSEKPQKLNASGTSGGNLPDSNGCVVHASDDRLGSSVGQKEDKTAHRHGNAQHNACLGDNLVIPKRPRGASRRKKSDASVILKRTVVDLSSSSQKGNNSAPSSLLSGNSVTTPIASVSKHKKILGEHKESGSNSGRRGVLVEVIQPKDKEETTTGKATQKKVVRNHRKRRYSTSGKHAQLEKEGIFFQKSKESVEESHEDEEENLEENAARMLSSRFDPSCTGFSGSRTPPKPANGFPVHSQSFSADSNILGSKGSSLDDASRVLRPRRRNDKNAVRKRRHFYEVRAGDMDPYWVFNRRIKVFWPLDQIWYFGLIKDYNPDTKLHHVKYDDREEEWIDLQNERFKLLMFPSEFSGKLDSKKGDIDVKQKTQGDDNAIDDDYASSFMETEPIISWLARSIHRVKPSPLNILKERRRSHSNKHSSPPLLLDTEENKAACSSGVNLNRDSRSIAPELVVDGVNDVLVSKCREDIVDRRYSNFYSRRRFHKGRKGFSNSYGDNHADRGFIGASELQEALEFDITLNAVKLNQGIPEVRFSLSKIHGFVAPAESSRIFSIFWWLRFGRVMLLWPKVHVEIFFLDDIMGLKIVSYEGCLMHAIALLCLILRIFHQSICCRNPTQMQLPFTSIGCKFSGLQGVGRHVHFVAHYFLELESSKWAYLRHTLKKHCILRREIPFTECTYASTKNLLERSDLMPLVENTESISLLGHHLKLLMKNDISSSIFHNRNVMSTQDHQENHEKLTDDSCFPATDSSCLEDISSPDKSDDGNHYCLDTIHDQKQQVIQVEDQLLDGENKVASTPDLAWKVNNPTLHVLNPASFRSKGHHNRHNPVSPSFGHRSQPWPEDFLRDGFVNGHRKPRTRVSYSSPFGGYHFGTESQSRQKRHPYKKARTDNAKKVTTIYGNSQRSPTSYTCEANVLVSEGDRGWREDAAQVVLESDGHDWKILVKLSGITKFSYKAHQFLQPGTTNRYTHAMMWKGGKNWTLEFTDRSQWTIFKEMHEECYNRNVRAASVKNIPIPGVCLIEDLSDCSVEAPFVGSFPKYFRQVGTEVDIAMDPSRVIYDMDSDDEEWLSKQRSSSHSDGSELTTISDDIFEKAIDMLEKFAYAQQCDEFSDAEIESYMAEVGPMDAVKLIHEYWWSKRQKKRMPLIRQFQPPLWEQYQKQLKEWESAVSKASNSSNATDKGLLIEKPPMFAFCLKPRGLEAPHKGFKQRSHKKFQHSMITREQDTLQGLGRKLNGFSMGDDKALVMLPNQEFSDLSPWLQSPTGFSPRDTVNNGTAAMTNGGLDRSHHFKLHRNSSKKAGAFSSHGDFHMVSPSYNQKTKRTGFSRWNSGSQEWSNAKQIHSNGFHRHADIEEFRLRDASSAAQHASNMAKLKREKAQWLLHKADLALHRAVVALMTAEAMRASEKDLSNEEDEFE